MKGQFMHFRVCNISSLMRYLERNIAKLAILTTAAAIGTTVSASVIDRPFLQTSSVVIVFGGSDFAENGGEAPVVFDFNVLDGATSNEAAPDIIGLNGRTVNFNTGQFNPIQSGAESGQEFEVLDATFGGEFNSVGPHQTLDANDSYNAFGLDDDTDIDLLGNGARASRFFVASNTAFDIFGEAQNLETSGDFEGLDYSNIRFRLRVQTTGGSGVNRWGRSAQDPSLGGSGVVIGQTNAFTLEDLASGPVKVFDGGRRTARTRGSIFDHSVSFQSRYNLIGSAINGSNYDFSQGIGGIGADVVYTIYTP